MGALRFVVEPDEGKSIWLAGIGVDFKIWGEETGNQFSIVEHPIEPGRLIPPHVHSREDEFSYVLQGRVGARVGDEEATAGPGSYILKPRGILHTFWNAGPEPARILEIISPQASSGSSTRWARSARRPLILPSSSSAGPS